MSVGGLEGVFERQERLLVVLLLRECVVSCRVRARVSEMRSRGFLLGTGVFLWLFFCRQAEGCRGDLRLREEPRRRSGEVRKDGSLLYANFKHKNMFQSGWQTSKLALMAVEKQIRIFCFFTTLQCESCTW